VAVVVAVPEMPVTLIELDSMVVLAVVHLEMLPEMDLLLPSVTDSRPHRKAMVSAVMEALA
jgi:hypothetical protein